MDLNIAFEDGNDEEDIAALKKFLEEEGVQGLDNVSFEHAPLKAGDQGAGEIIGLIVNLAGAGVLNGVVGLLSQFCQQFDKRLKGPGGIVINSNGMTPEQRTQIAIAWAPK